MRAACWIRTTLTELWIPAGVVQQAIKSSEMAVRAVRQSGGVALISSIHAAASRF